MPEASVRHVDNDVRVYFPEREVEGFDSAADGFYERLYGLNAR